MKGIMSKRLLALLSAAGLAGTATSVSSQVLKGSEPNDKTKAESKIKYNKVQQEKNAAASGAAHKDRKAGGEQQAAKDVVNEKVGPDHIVHKHIAGVKYEDAASKDAAKMTKATNERKAGGIQQEDKHKLTKMEQENAAAAAQHKDKKVSAEKNASEKATWVKGGKTQSETNKKVDQASPK